MAGKIKVYLAATAQDSRAAEGLGIPGAWLFYKIGENGILQRAQTGGAGRGGVMGLMGGENLEKADPVRLARDIFMECNRRGMRGVMLDFDLSADGEKLEALCAQLAQKQMPHFLPQNMWRGGPWAKAVIPSALSGGSFKEMLHEQAERSGAENLCLEIVRMCHDFVMPAYSPEGVALSAQQFKQLLDTVNPTPYFSPDMQCKYFTYNAGGVTHFVLFDDANTAAGKIETAESLGFYAAFLLYSEWGAAARDIAAH